MGFIRATVSRLGIVQSFKAWIAVRYFDSNLNQIGAIRSAKYDGINYNFTTGKAVELHAHFIEIDTMQPVGGTADNEFTKFLGSD